MKNPQVLDATLQNVVVGAPWHPGFAPQCILIYIHIYTKEHIYIYIAFLILLPSDFLIYLSSKAC
jgi:hypothetical protein